MFKRASAEIDLPKDFDESEYLFLNPDIIDSGIPPAIHFAKFGKAEGRLYKSGNLVPGERSFDPKLKTCLLVTHDLSLTGSPMLALDLIKNFENKVNVIILSYNNDGKLLNNFKQNSSALYLCDTNPQNSELIEIILEKILGQHGIDFAIANSSVTRKVLPALNKVKIPSISLIHEFASYAPEDAVKESIEHSQITVFSSKAILNDAKEKLELKSKAEFPVINQGLNKHKGIVENALEIESARLEIDRALGNEQKNIVGIGSVILTKGVDLFINVAEKLEKLSPGAYRFIWVANVNDLKNGDYGFFVSDSIKRSKYLAGFKFLDNTTEIEYLLSKVDGFALTSRLDTMPNVAIETMAIGKPVFSFENTGGIPELIEANGLKDSLIAEYLDTSDMALKIDKLLNNEELLNLINARMKEIASKTFDSQRYANQILEQLQRAELILQN